MPWPTPEELESLVARFRDKTLPAAEWTHSAHLCVGTWHVRRFGADEALAQLRPGIRRLNEAHGTPNSDTRGYHETITRAYVALIAQHLAGCEPGAPTAECVRSLLESPLSGREHLLRYYSRDRLMSVEARHGWLEPDLAPLLL